MIDIRKIPQDDIAESCLLGSMLLCADSTKLKAVCRRLEPDDFYDGALGAYGSLYASIKARVMNGKPLDAGLIRSDLIDRGQYDILWGDDRFWEVTDSVPHAANVEEWAGKVKAKSDARKALSVHENAIKRLCECVEPYEQIADSASRLLKLRFDNSQIVARTSAQAVYGLYENLEKQQINSLQSCLYPVQDILGGYKFRRMHVVAALPSVGKSTLARQELAEWSIQKINCGLSSVEETEEMVAEKLLANYSEVPNYRISGNRLQQEDWKKLAAGAARCGNNHLVIVEPGFMLDDVIASIELLVQKHQCRAVAVDHFHLIRAKGYSNETEMQTLISNTLKQKIKELGIVGIVVAQLNKQLYAQDKGKRVARPPNRGDLRGSGALDQDADAVILLHRKDEFHKGEAGYWPDNIAQFIIAKNRGGRCGDTGQQVKWNGDYQRYEAGIKDPFGVPADPWDELPE